MAQAAIEDARANFDQAEENLKRTVLRAPFTGLVRAESIGQFTRGQPIATLRKRYRQVRLPIADRQLAYLNLPRYATVISSGNAANVTLKAEYGGQTLEWIGKIVRAEAEIDTASRMVSWLLEFAVMKSPKNFR